MPRMTTAELDAYNARQRKPNKLLVDLGLEVGPIKSTRESVLHRQVAQELYRAGIDFSASRMDKRTGRHLGEQDFTIYLDGGKMLLVELKTPWGKLSEDQVRWAERLAKRGHTVHVVRSLVEFKELLKGNQ